MKIEEMMISDLRREFEVMLTGYTKAQLQFLTMVDDVSRMTADPEILKRMQQCLAEVQAIHTLAKAQSRINPTGGQT